VKSGARERHDIRHVFLFIGADPETGWLGDCVDAYDAKGFVVTGRATTCTLKTYTPALLESSIPGVFAVGDVRSGSVKRVGSANAEGAAEVADIHQFLAHLHSMRAAAPAAAAVA
jgi:thioredoxin reductase (NADPH)